MNLRTLTSRIRALSVISSFLLGCAILSAVSMSVWADEPAVPPVVAGIGAWLQPILLGLVGKYPVIMGILAVVGVLRLCLKPVFSILHAIADATPSPNDNLLLDKVEKSPVLKAVYWVLDYLASIKLAVK